MPLSKPIEEKLMGTKKGDAGLEELRKELEEYVFELRLKFFTAKFSDSNSDGDSDSNSNSTGSDPSKDAFRYFN